MRFQAFGKENPKTLLNPLYVAQKTLMILLSKMSGQVIDIKKQDEEKL